MTMIEEAEIAAQHDSPTPHHAAGGLMGEETYRGWSIGPAYVGWSATGPNFDASWEGEEDGWVSNGECSWGWTREECIAGIDEWFEEHCNA